MTYTTRKILSLLALTGLLFSATACVVKARTKTRSQPVEEPPPQNQGTVVAPGRTAEPAPPPPPPPVPPNGIRGTVDVQVGCTRKACPPNVCCNSCNVTATITPTEGEYVGQPMNLSDHGCRADGCGNVTGCPIQAGEIHTFNVVDVRCRRGECFTFIKQW